MRKFGLIGYPLSHSFSPGYFATKFKAEGIEDAQYDLYPLEDIDAFADLEGFRGINVTIPYKEKVIPFLDELTKEAEQIGAVNTILFEDGKKIGHNTDVYGFEISLTSMWKEGTQPKSALVLGTGGAAKAVWHVLDKLGIKYIKVSRSKGELKYSEVKAPLIQETKLIINTTPLGMAPKFNTCAAIPYEALTEEHILYDLVYNPEKTLFLIKGESHKTKVKNGYDMLALQAEKSWDIWNDKL